MALLLVMAGCRSAKDSGHQASDGGQRRIVSTAELETEAMLIEAKMSQETGQVEKALQGYQTVLTRNPKCDAALYGLATMYEDAAMFDSALFYAQKAEAIDKNNQWYKLQLCSLYHSKADYRNEARTWEQLLKLAPDKIDYYYELSNAYLAAEDVNAAIDALNRVEKIIGVTEPVSLQKQKLWSAVGKNDKAILEIQRLADAMPQEKKYSEIMAEMYMKQKNYDKAKKYYDQIAAAHPDDEYIHISLANYYHQTGDKKSTYNELEKGLRSDALSCTDKLQIIVSIYSNGEFYDTIDSRPFSLLEQCITACHDTIDYEPLYGEVLMNRGRWHDAAKRFRHYLDFDPSRYEVWQAYLICLSVENVGGDSLITTVKKVQALFPFQTLPYFMEGQHYVIKREYEKAEKPLVYCIKLGFNNGYLETDTYEMLAEVYYRLQRQEEAWQCFEKALKVNPDNIPTLNNYAYYLSEMSLNLEKAELMSKKTIIAEPENSTYLDTYAWVLYKMGRARDALPYIEKAVRNDKGNSNTLQEHLKAIQSAIH
mgnify:CR=1 FL=1